MKYTKILKIATLLIVLTLMAACGNENPSVNGINDTSANNTESTNNNENINDTSAPQSACDMPYFPVRLGSTWTYAITSGGGFTWTIISVEGDMGNATATIESVYQGVGEEPTKEIINFECSQEGLFSSNFFFVNLPGFRILEATNEGFGWYPPTESIGSGSSWANRSTVIAEMSEAEGVQIILDFERTLTNFGVENVEATAGNFNAIRITSDTTLTMFMAGVEVPGGKSYSESVWWGEGVGLVRNDSTTDGITSTNLQLVSYSIP